MLVGIGKTAYPKEVPILVQRSAEVMEGLGKMPVRTAKVDGVKVRVERDVYSFLMRKVAR